MTRIRALLALALVAAAALALGGPPQSAQADPTDDRYFSQIIRVGNKTFYPLVRDGYRDEAIVRIEDNLDYWRIHADVYTASGRHIRKLHVISKWDDDFEWSEAHWNGKKTDGSPARKGEYTIIITAVTSTQNDQGEWVDTHRHSQPQGDAGRGLQGTPTF